MTIRELIAERKRRLMRICMVGFYAAMATCVWSIVLPRYAAAVGAPCLPLVAAGIATGFYCWTFAFRCPACRANWTELVMGYAGIAGVFTRPGFAEARECPSCGVDLDGKWSSGQKLGRDSPEFK